MKRLLIITIALCLLLCGCAEKKEVPSELTVTKDGVLYEVDTAQGTIFDGTNTYQYTLSPYGNGYEVKIVYPDGSDFWWTTTKNAGYGGFSDTYDPQRYVDGHTLLEVIETVDEGETSEKEKPAVDILLVILLLAVGIFQAVFPKMAWKIRRGWEFKDAEPTDTALTTTSIFGVVSIVVAVLLLLK